MKNKMGYFASQIVATIFVFIVVFLIKFYIIKWPYMPSSYYLPSPSISALIAFAISFCTKRISNKMMSVGNSLTKKASRILYYPLTLLIIVIVIITGVSILLSIFPYSLVVYLSFINNSSIFIILYYYLYVICCSFIIVPYIQSIIRVIVKDPITTNNVNEETPKNNKGLIIAVIITILIILCLTGYIICDKVLNKDKENTNKATNVTNNTTENVTTNEVEQANESDNDNGFGVFDVKKEQEYLDSAYTIRVGSVSKYYSMKVNWYSNNGEETIEGKKIISSIPGDINEGLDGYFVTEDGSLYTDGYDSETDTEIYSKIDIPYKAKRVGEILVPSVGDYACIYGSITVVEATDGKQYKLTYDFDTKLYDVNTEFKGLSKSKNPEAIFGTPICGQNDLIDRVIVYSNGNIGFDKDLSYKGEDYNKELDYKYVESKMIKENGKALQIEYLLFTGNDSAEKYYVVSQDNKLYIIDKEEKEVKNVATVKRVTINNFDKFIAAEEQISSDDEYDHRVTITLSDGNKLVFAGK